MVVGAVREPPLRLWNPEALLLPRRACPELAEGSLPKGA